RVFSVFHLSATQHTSPSLVPYTTLFRSDGPFDGGGPDGRTSVWAWQPHIKAQILQGIGYWANVLQLQGDQGPAVLNVGTDGEEGNAFGYSPPGLSGKDSRTLLQRHFQGLPVAE